MKRKIIIPSFLLVIITAFVFQSCKEELEDYVPKEYIGADESYLRIINTASIPRRVDYFVNNTKVNGDSLAYNASYPGSEFLRVKSGDIPVKVNAPGLGADIYNATFKFDAGKYNTLFLIDTLPNIDSYLITDDALVPPADSGKAYIRFVHVTKGLGNLSIANNTVTSPVTPVDTVFKNVSYKSHTPFKAVNSGSQRYQVYTAGTTTTVGAALTVTLTPNRIYTLYIRGRGGVTGTYAPTLGSLVTR